MKSITEYQKQKLIVRQSCIDHAVAFESGRGAEFKTADVLDTAQTFEKHVWRDIEPVEMIYVEFPYSKEGVEWIKNNVKEAKWDSGRRMWQVPATSEVKRRLTLNLKNINFKDENGNDLPFYDNDEIEYDNPPY